MTESTNSWIPIPTELIGSLPRVPELVEAERTYRDGELTADQLTLLQEKDLENVLVELEKTGSPQLTDGELTKPSFFSYPIFELTQLNFSFDEENLPTIKFADGHQRTLPRLIKAPFQYAKYAVDYLHTARRYTKFPLKQAVIAPSALSLVYTCQTIKDYSREQFLQDLINEAEKDIRLCLEAGAEKVQLDFTEARLSIKWDSHGKLLRELIDINNRLLERFNQHEKMKLGVHICAGNDKGSTHSANVDYCQVLEEVFRLDLNNFYIQLSTEKDPEKVLLLISKLIQPQHRIFIGVINPADLNVETPEEVRDRILQAAKYIPINQLGTTDDCGFAPFNDNETITRKLCYEKIRARIKGTKLAEEILNQPF